jgi:membrane associated rhomboid family serine protease
VRQTIRKDVEDQLVARVRASKTEGERGCPRCSQPMTLVDVPRGPRPVALDVCYPCASIWFDAREYEVLKAMYGLEEPPKRMLDHKWKWALALLGMPVERQTSAMLHRPWLTWLLAAVIAIVSAWAWFITPWLQYQLCLVPAFAWRMGGLTLLTSFFLHGGFLHLFANLYFMVVFGDNVEDYLGKRRYLILLLAATLAGNFLHIAMDPRSDVPLIGASGGISGLVVFYGLQFPRVRLLFLMRLLFFYPVRLSASAALLLWFLVQLIGAWKQIAGFSNVSSLAHLGGAAVGLVFWLAWKNRLDVPPNPSGASASA